MARRGFSNVLVAGVILLLAATIFTAYMVYLDSGAYRVSELGRSVERSVYRAGEELTAYLDGGTIVLRNSGETPLRVEYLVVLRNGEVSFEEVGIGLPPGGEDYIQAPISGYPLYLITERGRVFPLGGQDTSGGGGSGGFNSFYTSWINETTVIIHGDQDPFNQSAYDRVERLERGIALFRGDAGYAVIDLIENRTLYEGVRMVIPTRDGLTLATSRGVFIEGVYTLSSRPPLYVGYDYMVLGGVNTVIAGAKIGVLTLPSPGRLIFNGNRTYYMWLEGEVNGLWRHGLLSIDPMNISLRETYYVDLPMKILFGEEWFRLHNFNGYWIVDDGFRPVRIVITARDPSINGWMSMVVTLREYLPGVYIADGIRYTDDGYVEGIQYDQASSTVGGSGFPLFFATGLHQGQDRMVYNLDGEGRIGLLLRYTIGGSGQATPGESSIVLRLESQQGYVELLFNASWDGGLEWSIALDTGGGLTEIRSGGVASGGWILLSMFPDTSLGIYTANDLVGLYSVSLSPPYRLVVMNSSAASFSPYITVEVFMLMVDPESWVVHENYYGYAVSNIQNKPTILLPYFYGAVGIRFTGDVYFSSYGPVAVYNYWELPNVYMLEPPIHRVTSLRDDDTVGVYILESPYRRLDVYTGLYMDWDVIPYTEFYLVVSIHPKALLVRKIPYA